MAKKKEPDHIFNENELLGDLENTLGEWCGKHTENENLPGQCGAMWWGENTYRLMAKAAWLVLEAQRDEHAILESEGQLKND